MAKKKTETIDDPPDLSNIAADLRHLATPIKEISLDPANVRRHDERNLSALAESLATYGQVKPIVVNRKTKLIEAGNGTFAAAARLGWTHLACVLVDHDNKQHALFALADNRISDLSSFDEPGLKKLFADLAAQESATSADLIGWTEKEAAAIQGLTPAPKQPDIELKYSVVVDCPTEADQLAILKELDRNGIDAKAVCAGFEPVKQQPATDPPQIEAKGKRIVRSTPIARTPRVKQLEGIFDVPPSKKSEHAWTVDFTLDRPWHIGLIVGPSGSGKSTLARELFEANLVAGWEWPADQSIVDGFPAALSIHDITGLLSSVGFSSPPSWLKPYHVLSNGEQFRVNLARTLAEAPELAVVDEFTSVVDRTVAQIGSAALAKTIRLTNRRFVAVSCHYDIEEWLQPDWKYDTASGEFLWRSLRQRPPLSIRIRRTDAQAWKIFAHHHYLSTDLAKAARCFLAEIDGRPAAFASVIHNPHKNGGWWREHRTVCLPDLQGVGLGNALSEFVAGVFAATGKQYRSTTSHPAMMRHRCKSPLWKMYRAPDFSNPAFKPAESRGRNFRGTSTIAMQRAAAGFLYVGPPNLEAAIEMGITS